MEKLRRQPRVPVVPSEGVAPNFDAKAIGDRIARARLEAGLSQDELAGLGSWSKRSLQDYEKGDTIPFKHMRELGDLLKKEPVWFLYGDEHPLTPVGQRLDALERKLDEVARLMSQGLADLFAAIGESHRPRDGDPRQGQDEAAG